MAVEERDINEGTGNPQPVVITIVTCEDNVEVLIAKVDSIYNTLIEQTRELLRESTNGALVCDRIEKHSGVCVKMLASLPQRADGLRDWIREFCKERQELRNIKW